MLYLFVAMVVMMPLDIFIALHDRPLYDFYLHTPKLGGISALADQRIAGATTALMETAVLSIAMFIAAGKLVAESRSDRALAGQAGGIDWRNRNTCSGS